MQLLKQTSIRTTFRTIQTLVAMLLVLLVAEGMILWNVCEKGSQANHGLIAEGLPSLRTLATFEENLALYRLHSYELMFAQEQDRPAKAAQADDLGRQNRQALADLRMLISNSDGLARLSSVEKELTNYVESINQMRSKLDKDFPGAMQILDKEIPPQIKRLEEATTQLKDYCQSLTSERASQNVAAFASIQKSVVGLGSTNIGFALIVSILVILSSTRIHRVLTSLATRLSPASEQINGSSGTVASASQSLAEGASEQAASLEETSSSLEEMSSMTKRNAENADKAKDLATESRQAADTGTADVQKMTGAMDAIKNSSHDISKIIKTIDEIAFQTNILALNAAVEAARAGEAGMGFAVVAEEVRNLAQRSAQAARETASKIEGAISNTEQGVLISGKVVQVLTEIATKVRQVDSLIGEVAAASKEQSQGIEQVNSAITQMDKVTQSNAAGAEETASAAQDLNSQTSYLKEAVEELLLLVGGAATKEIKIQPIVSPTPDSRFDTPSRTQVTVGQTRSRRNKPALTQASHQAIKPGDIPMDDDFSD